MSDNTKPATAGSPGAAGSALPAGCRKLIQMMQNGFKLYWGDFGPWMVDPVDSRCVKVHIATARALVRRRLITRGQGLAMVLSPNATGSATEGRP